MFLDAYLILYNLLYSFCENVECDLESSKAVTGGVL